LQYDPAKTLLLSCEVIAPLNKTRCLKLQLRGYNPLAIPKNNRDKEGGVVPKAFLWKGGLKKNHGLIKIHFTNDFTKKKHTLVSYVLHKFWLQPRSK
jgi:hypothetical protein